MCGIVGVIASTRVDAAIVARMRDTLAHRGPDHAGIWSSGDGRVCLGHRRLSIIDLDARANQPMVSADGRFVITYNGEIYNYRSVRRDLEKAGAAFRTDSDTEVLIEAYRRWGGDALDRLSGMFSFALWDERERRLFCARDRAGEKPFHYALAGGAFLFASEMKALAQWPALPRRVDYEAMIDFLAFGFVADPKTIWSDVRKLAPAHALCVELREDGPALAGAPQRYWSLRFDGGQRPAGPDEIRATILRAADEMAIADVPLGTFLSGGVDSSAVTAGLSLSGHSVRSFTIGFEHDAYDERHWARQVAERYRTEHVERIVAPDDMGSVLDRLGWHYDEPFADYSSVPTYFLCREARKSITVALSGDGADELFAGYRKYQRLVRRTEVGRIVPRPVARALSGAAHHALREGHPLRRTLAHYGMGEAEMLADMFCIGFTLPLLRATARGPLGEALRHYDPHRLVAQLLVEAPPEKVGLVDAMRHLDLALTLPGDILTKVDRASMAVSLEVRPLFLHREVMELAAGIPARDLVSHGAAKLALKNAVRPWLPDALLDRPKMGFAMPLPQWLAQDSPIASRVRGVDSAGPLGEVLDMERVAGFARAHAAGAGNFTNIVHSVFVLDQWFAKWMAGAAR